MPLCSSAVLCSALQEREWESQSWNQQWQGWPAEARAAWTRDLGETISHILTRACTEPSSKLLVDAGVRALGHRLSSVSQSTALATNTPACTLQTVSCRAVAGMIVRRPPVSRRDRLRVNTRAGCQSTTVLGSFAAPEGSNSDSRRLIRAALMLIFVLLVVCQDTRGAVEDEFAALLNLHKLPRQETCVENRWTPVLGCNDSQVFHVVSRKQEQQLVPVLITRTGMPLPGWRHGAMH